MKSKIIIASIVLSIMSSCSVIEDKCKCNEYITSTNGNTVLYGEASMKLCDGTIANPSPKTTSYQKECK